MTGTGKPPRPTESTTARSAEDRFATLDLAAVSHELSAFFADPSQFPDPYPMFRRLRELEPVHWSEYNAWTVTGYPEAEEILHNSAFARQASAMQQFRNLGVPGTDPPEVVEAVDIFLAALINRDPPDHTRLRRLVSRSFTPRAMTAWQPRITAIVDELLDRVSDKDEFDLLHDVAYPLPSMVICELLGVPYADLEKLQATVSHSKIMTVRGGSRDVAPPPEDLRHVAQLQMAAQVEYFREVVADRRRDPRSDLISSLVEAEDEGDRLSMDELIGTVIVLIGAGHETTANLVANGTLALLQHRKQWDHLRDNRALLPNAIEEILRHASPSRGQPRTATQTVDVGGKTIEAGQQVSIILNACNRDPRVFDDPDRFDITRPIRPHITFTTGIHFCLGAALARAEATAMFAGLLDRLPDLTLATDDLRWRPAYVRGLEALPVARHSAPAGAHTEGTTP